MPENYETVRNQIFVKLSEMGPSDEKFSELTKSLKTLEEAHKINHESVDPVKKSFWQEHSSELIRIGGTLATVVLIGAIEMNGGVLLKSKASKYL